MGLQMAGKYRRPVSNQLAVRTMSVTSMMPKLSSSSLYGGRGGAAEPHDRVAAPAVAVLVTGLTTHVCAMYGVFPVLLNHRTRPSPVTGDVIELRERRGRRRQRRAVDNQLDGSGEAASIERQLLQARGLPLAVDRSARDDEVEDARIYGSHAPSSGRANPVTPRATLAS